MARLTCGLFVFCVFLGGIYCAVKARETRSWERAMEQSKKNKSERVQISDLEIGVIWDAVLKGVENGSIQDPEKAARSLVDARRFLKGLITERSAS